MSLTPIGEPRHKVTTASLREQKLRHDPISCLTAYDYATARLVDEAGIDMVLVGDSLAQTMLGYENTLSVTMDEMLHHVQAGRRRAAGGPGPANYRCRDPRCGAHRADAAVRECDGRLQGAGKESQRDRAADA